jgi:glycerate-2-kinase
MRITNIETLIDHGNVAGRKHCLQIIEAGLASADPYHRMLKLVRVEGDRLVVGGQQFEPAGSPVTGDQIYDLTQLGRIFVLGAGKGIQRVAKAIEDVLDDRLTGGHVIDKKGGGVILDRIEVTLGAHPVPDEDCVRGCKRIWELTNDLDSDDLVFTLGASGFSSLLTLPAPGISLEDVRRTVYLMQIERGAPTQDLSPIRNHLDLLKGGQIAACIHPAHAIHIIAKDPGSYEQLIYHNTWIHTLPDRSTFADAIASLKKWDAWDAVPASVRQHLLRADPRYETVKPARYLTLGARIYGVMAGQRGQWPAARGTAKTLGYQPVTLATNLTAEASQAGLTVAAIAQAIEQAGTPFEPPVALLTGGELLVTVGQEAGIGGRNQEFALAAAVKIAGSAHIVIGAVDTDGTDGPGSQYTPGHADIPTLAGGIVDGNTVARAETAGLDIDCALRSHDTTPLLLALGDGILATQSTGLRDLGVVLITARNR